MSLDAGVAARADERGKLDRLCRYISRRRWQFDRARAWSAFLYDAEPMLNALAEQQEALLAQYEIEACGRYGGKDGG